MGRACQDHESNGTDKNAELRSAAARMVLMRGLPTRGDESRCHPEREKRVPGTCEIITKSCHPERSEESAVVCFQKDKSRFFASLRMTDDFFTAS
jgi:hypothetical protein